MDRKWQRSKDGSIFRGPLEEADLYNKLMIPQEYPGEPTKFGIDLFSYGRTSKTPGWLDDWVDCEHKRDKGDKDSGS